MIQAPRDTADPMMEMNTTPLIDVMLVLLIMFIVTIPMQSHAVKLDLPGKGPVVQPDRVKNSLIVAADGGLQWNGAPVVMAELRRNLELTTQMSPQPELHIRPDPQARYEVVDEVRALAKKAEVSRLGFVGNEAFARF